MPPILIALGSNVGDRLAHLRDAATALAATMKVCAGSPIYETAPMYVEDQTPFLNAAIVAETTRSPRGLLATLKAIEASLGRTHGRRYGPREVDLDLIAYGVLGYRFVERQAPQLVVPHPRVAERRFVLRPLADIAPEYHLPGLGIVRELLAQTESQAAGVTRIDDALFPVPRN